jgi:uncharacterized membrane protein (UPF0182 family)
LPVGNSFLYVEPLYVQKSSGASAFPALDAILVSYGDEVGYGSSVSDALTHLAPAGQVPPLRSAVGGGAPTTNPTSSSPPPSSSSGKPPPNQSSSPSAPPPSNAQAVLNQLNAAFNKLSDAYKSGDLAKIGTAQADVQRLTEQYLKLLSSSPTPSKTR